MIVLLGIVLVPLHRRDVYVYQVMPLMSSKSLIAT